jgi:hypothetical protein
VSTTRTRDHEQADQQIRVAIALAIIEAAPSISISEAQPAAAAGELIVAMAEPIAAWIIGEA